MKNRTVVPNRIFLAYQWLFYRPIFEGVCADLHRTYPVYFYAVGRPAGQPAQAVVDKIKSVLLSSMAAMFDASRGNANVSLEYGLAHFVPNLPNYLLIDQHVLPNQVNVGTAIISDLAGSTQNRWNVQDPTTLKTHLQAIAENHEYTKRSKRYCRDRGMTRGQFRSPLKVIRIFDERETILRRELSELRLDPADQAVTYRDTRGASCWSQPTERTTRSLARPATSGIEALGLGTHCDVPHLITRSRRIFVIDELPEAMFGLLLEAVQRAFTR